MRMVMKGLLAVLAVVSLAPTAAFAWPEQQCDEYCWMLTCADPCAVANRWTTCGERYPTWCNPSVTPAPTEPSASLNPEEARQAEGDSLVCSEENPAA